MNKYERTPEEIIDLHGCTKTEAEHVLRELLISKKFSHVRIITGKGIYRKNGPVLGPFVKMFLEKRNIRFSPAKITDGGDGALEVFLN